MKGDVELAKLDAQWKTVGEPVFLVVDVPAVYPDVDTCKLPCR